MTSGIATVLSGTEVYQNPVVYDIATSIVIPLGQLQSFKNKSMANLTPEIEYEREKLLLLTPQLASIPSKTLKDPIGSLNHFRDDIIATLDFAITGIQRLAKAMKS